jgi:hypothetical protein
MWIKQVAKPALKGRNKTLYVWVNPWSKITFILYTAQNNVNHLSMNLLGQNSIVTLAAFVGIWNAIR